jgi:hypothetical protein
MAAAVSGQVETLVTWNEKDFNCEFMKNHAVAVVNPDVYHQDRVERSGLEAGRLRLGRPLMTG